MTVQRRDPRLPATLQVGYRTAGAFLISYSINLSKGGIFIESQEPLPVGTAVTLQLEVPDAGAFELVGQVAWVRKGSPDGLPDGIGIQLRELDERYGAAIDRLVQDFVGLTVLVLAGAPERLVLLGRYVRSIIACDVLEATSLDEAREALASQPDLIVLDVERSKRLDASSVAALKKHSSAAPVILLAGDLRSRELGKLAGADEVLETPPSFHALQAAVIRTLSRPNRVAL